MSEAAATRPAATVIVLRQGPPAQPVQLLMVRRHGRAGFAADAWVFPGGVVDPADATLAPSRWTGLDLHRLAERFRAPAEAVLAHHVAAVRETFEEAGLLLARHADGTPPDLTDPGLLRLRQQLADARDAATFTDWVEQQDLVLDLGALTYLSWWATPTAERRRYDARFFLARSPAEQTALHDRMELTDQRWIGADTALEQHRAGEMPMIYPTIKTLEQLAVHQTVDEAIGAAQHQPPPRRVQPHAVLDADGRLERILHPDDPDYPHHLYPASA
ncbi:MAG TPA: NUDIX hydrolase [Egibacteraceae bacterium]|nr:NUDIX hydrolase [Egibacteraceae bacterium]